eukprot:6234402-Amphidinium_carterae.1
MTNATCRGAKRKARILTTQLPTQVTLRLFRQFLQENQEEQTVSNMGRGVQNSSLRHLFRGTANNVHWSSVLLAFHLGLSMALDSYAKRKRSFFLNRNYCNMDSTRPRYATVM